MSIVKSNDVPLIVEMLERLGLPGEFRPLYMALATLLTRRRQSTQTARIAFRTPPTQTTVPANPNLTGGSDSSKLSNSSSESKGEPYAQNVAIKLLEVAFITTARWVRPREWTRPEANVSFFVQ